MNNYFTTQPGFTSTTLDIEKALEFTILDKNDENLERNNKVRVLLEIEIV